MVVHTPNTAQSFTNKVSLLCIHIFLKTNVSCIKYGYWEYVTITIVRTRFWWPKPLRTVKVSPKSPKQ